MGMDRRQWARLMGAMHPKVPPPADESEAEMRAYQERIREHRRRELRLQARRDNLRLALVIATAIALLWLVNG
jgi:hypothetical protein